MEPLTHARIGYDNILTRAASIEAGANDGSPASSAANPLTYSHWRATLGAPRTYTVTMDGPETVDYIGIAAHNLNSENVLVRMQALINGAWRDTSILAGPTPGDVWTWDLGLVGERRASPGATAATRVPGVARDGGPVLGPVGVWDPSEAGREFLSGELQCRGTVVRRPVYGPVAYATGTNLLPDNVITGTDTLGNVTGFSGPNLSSDTAQSVHGSRSLRMDYDEGSNSGVPFLSYAIGGGSFTIQFQLRTSGDVSGLSIVFADDVDQSYTLPLTGMPPNTWFALRLPADDALTPAIGANLVRLWVEGSTTGATLWFDNFGLNTGFPQIPWLPPGETEYVEQIGELLSTVNLLDENVRTGTDFLGDTTGFVDDIDAPASSSTTRAVSGSRSLAIPFTGSVGADIVEFAVTAPGDHTFSAKIWLDAVAAPELILTVEDDTDPGVPFAQADVPQLTGQWLQISVTGTPDPAAETILVRIAGTGTGTLYLDELQAEVGDGWTPWYNGTSPADITVHGTHSITLEPALENLLPSGTRDTSDAGAVTGDVEVDTRHSVSGLSSFLVQTEPDPGVFAGGSFSTDPITPTPSENHVGQLKVYLEEAAWVRLCLEDDDNGENNYEAFEGYLTPGVWHTVITSGAPGGGATELWLNFEALQPCWVAEPAINETEHFVQWADGVRAAGDLAYRPELLQAADALTVNAWVRLPSEQPDDDQRILYLYRTGGGLFDSLAIQRNATSDELRFEIANAEGLTLSVEPEVTCDGKWHMLTAVMGPTSIALYFDGVLADSAAVPSADRLPDLSGLSAFEVGHATGMPSIGDHPAILLDDMITLGSALAASDIVTLYAHEGAYTLDDAGLPLPVTDDRPIMRLVEPVTAAQFRLIFTPQESPSEDLMVGSIFIGKALEMARPLYSGHIPSPFARVTSVRPNLSERGQLLGRSITRSGMAGSWAWQNLRAAWVRRYLQPFFEHARTDPFFVLWRPETFPDEASYCWTEEDLRASNMGMSDLMAFTLTAVGL